MIWNKSACCKSNFAYAIQYGFVERLDSIEINKQSGNYFEWTIDLVTFDQRASPKSHKMYQCHAWLIAIKMDFMLK